MNNYQAEFPLEFCALRFLLQWLGKEEQLHRALVSNPTDEHIRAALAYFQVSRNFKGLGNQPEKASLIRDLLVKTRTNPELTIEKKVEELAKTFKDRFKKCNLSAASKLLWLSFRNPVIIYDQRAEKALSKKLNCKPLDGSYSSYTEAWRRLYADYESEIGDAVTRLPRGRIFMPKCLLTDEELLRTANEPWFKERVFDTFLWEVGGNS
jgi:hypothetical protein